MSTAREEIVERLRAIKAVRWEEDVAALESDIRVDIAERSLPVTREWLTERFGPFMLGPGVHVWDLSGSVTISAFLISGFRVHKNRAFLVDNPTRGQLLDLLAGLGVGK